MTTPMCASFATGPDGAASPSVSARGRQGPLQGYRADLADVAHLLASLRYASGFSQPELSFRLDISQRHLSFVERARARPGRDLVGRWCKAVGATTSQRNAAYLLAGYALPVAVPADDLLWSQDVVCHFEGILEAYDPHPAFVFGPDWRVVRMNRSGREICGELMPDYPIPAHPQGEGLDLIACCAHPAGLLARMIDPEVFGWALVSQLKVEAAMTPALRYRVARLSDALEARFGPASAVAGVLPDLRPAFLIGSESRRYRMLQTLLAYPQNAGIASPRLEIWLPDTGAEEARQAA